MKNTLVVLLCLSLFGCATMGDSSTDNKKLGNNDVIISSNFDFSKHKRIAVLPFQNSGKDGFDYSITDEVSMHCIELGFIVVERTQLEKIFQELKLELTGALSQSDITKIGKILNINCLVLGTMNYKWQPEVSVATGYGAASKAAHYYLDAETLRFVDVATGEVLISGYVDTVDTENGSYGAEIFKILKNKLFPPKIENKEN